MEPHRTEELLTLAKELLAESELHRLLTRAVDHAIAVTGAARGMIILFDEQGETCFETARTSERADLQSPRFEINLALLSRVRQERCALCLRQTEPDSAPPRLNQSSKYLNSLSPICVPLCAQTKVFGVLYLDHHAACATCDFQICAFMLRLAELISRAAQRALEHRQLRQYAQSIEIALRDKYQFEAIIGHHPKMVEILKLVSQVSDTDATVLIHGESGTGKELIARALHFNSRRKDHRFVPVNCAALTDNLLESELFGHVRGAFTGAVKDKVGWFECANGGTIFLDEVSEMSPALQVKVLRVLQTGEYARVGSTKICSCDVRVIAASSKPLLQLVKASKFREEVYYRLNVMDLSVPPLRERKTDLPLLIQHFLRMYGPKYGKPTLVLSPEAEYLLLAYDFPGNVRELENLIQRAIVLAEGEVLEPRHLPAMFSHESIFSGGPGAISRFQVAKYNAVEKFEREYIVECLRATQGNISRAAHVAGIDFKNLHDKIKKYGIDPRNFKEKRMHFGVDTITMANVP